MRQAISYYESTDRQTAARLDATLRGGQVDLSEETVLATELGVCDRPYDPYEAIVTPLTGDWAGVRGCADVFHNSGMALTEMGGRASARAAQPTRIPRLLRPGSCRC